MKKILTFFILLSFISSSFLILEKIARELDILENFDLFSKIDLSLIFDNSYLANSNLFIIFTLTLGLFFILVIGLIFLDQSNLLTNYLRFNLKNKAPPLSN